MNIGGGDVANLFACDLQRQRTDELRIPNPQGVTQEWIGWFNAEYSQNNSVIVLTTETRYDAPTVDPSHPTKGSVYYTEEAMKTDEDGWEQVISGVVLGAHKAFIPLESGTITANYIALSKARIIPRIGEPQQINNGRMVLVRLDSLTSNPTICPVE